jgi:hypothetical protein
MSVTEDHIRELLRERSSLPPSNSDRLSQVKVGIRRARRRRIVRGGGTAAVAVAGVIAVGALGGAGRAGGVDPVVRPSPLDTTPAPALAELPNAFAGKDGTEYVRVADTTLRIPEQQQVTLTVPVRDGRPLDVAATCAPRTKASPDDPNTWTSLAVLVDGQWYGGLRLVCGEKLELAQVLVPERARKITITFKGDWFRGGRASAVWSLGVYEWIPPDKPKAAPAVPQMPERSVDPDGEEPAYELLGSKGGIWPDSRTAEITVPYHGQQLEVGDICRGGAADRVEAVGILIDGKLHTDTPCETSGRAEGALNTIDTGVLNRAAKDGSVTIGLRIYGPNSNGRDDDAYAKRPIGWRVGIYQLAR